MPAPETAYLTQAAVLWPIEGYDAYGKPKVSDEAVELEVRWETRRTQARDALGNPIMLDAMAIVDRVIAVGSIMALGELEDWGLVGTGNASETGELMEVVNYMEVPDIKGRFSYREVGLKRWRDTLPEQVV